ncbi:hypothetical protein CVT26_006460 [Gymnopilus dilepis]|uniref:Hydrophobin n=1 Tax=Gymnopilus dilepis TaxID=231916 RepID=A0A409YTV8_9AGAR|nr:hypothetical protein CVT26_006460 [Gymnopilus dilepis]
MKFSPVLSLLALAAAALAAPNLEVRKESPDPDVTPTVTICIFSGSGCIPIPVTSSNCIDLTGGLTILNDNVGLVTAPQGFICDFFPAFGCSSFASTAIIGTGSAQFVSPGFPSFSSFLCSPIG